MVNGVKDVRIAHRRSDTGTWEAVVTWEYTAIGLPGGGKFSAHGDSGSFVLSRANNVIGMIFGGFDNNDYAILTPMDAILEDTKLSTGAEEVRIAMR